MSCTIKSAETGNYNDYQSTNYDSTNEVQDNEDTNSTSTSQQIHLKTTSDLSKLETNPDGQFVLDNDINLSAKEWVPLCQETPFTGIIDGNGHSINNFKISAYHKTCGFFATTGNAEFKNVIFENVDIDFETTVVNEISSAAIIVGEGTATFDSVTVKHSTLNATKRGPGEQIIGGFLGIGSGEIYNSISSISMENTDKIFEAVGGFIGETAETEFGDMPQTIINDSKNYSSIEGTIRTFEYSDSSGFGGLIGLTSYGVTISISRSYNYGNIIVACDADGYLEYSGIGGLIGARPSTTDVIYYCGNLGDLSESTTDTEFNLLIGGLVGYGEMNIDHSFNTGNILSGYVCGGIFGYSNSIVKNCFNTGSISGQTSGGITGQVGYLAEIYNSFNSGTLTYSGGGIVGSQNVYGDDHFTIEDCYNTGELHGVFSWILGGQIYKSPTITIKRVFNAGAFIKGPEGNEDELDNGEEPDETSSGILGNYDYFTLSNALSLNNAKSTDHEVNAFAESFIDFDYSNLYFEEGLLDASGKGEKIEDLSKLTKQWFENNMDYDTSIWDIDNIDLVNGSFPKLKDMPEIPSN